jgi:DNA-binding transcriptional regulator PaaX
MNARSTLETRKEGRKALYSLRARGRKIGSNVSLHFRGLDWSSWDGSYWTAAFSLPDAKERYRLQKKLGAYRFRALYPGLWIRPIHPEERVEEVFSEALGSGRIDMMRGAFARPLSKERIGKVFDLDPLLPPRLLPDPWPGDELRSGFARWREVMREKSSPFIEGSLSE